MTFRSIFKENKCILEKKTIDSKKILGFWIYLMSDCLIFGVLFAVFFVMRDSNITNLFIKKIFNIYFVAAETLTLLFSSLSYSMISYENNVCHIKNNFKWLLITFILGFIFAYMELYEFYNLYMKSYKPTTNGFFSVYYTLLGIHVLHIIIGLFWMIILICQHFFISENQNKTNYICLGLFWHFLDIIWICIFSFIYLIGIFL